MSRQILILVIFLQIGFTFKPRTFEVFEKNSLRLLANRQYSFLSDYFLEHCESFKREQGVIDLGLKIVRNCPLPKFNSQLLTYLLKLQSPNLNKRELFFECGLFHYFEENWLKASKFFALSHRLIANFYLGECQIKLNHFQKARDSFNDFLKWASVNHPIVPFARFKLAMLAYKKKQYRESYRLLLKSKYHGVERNILLYQIYDKTRELKFKDEIMDLLKEKYRDDIKFQTFLDNF